MPSRLLSMREADGAGHLLARVRGQMLWTAGHPDLRLLSRPRMQAQPLLLESRLSSLRRELPPVHCGALLTL